MMIDRTKVRLFERQAEIARAVAHPLRIAVLDFLQDGERCVCEIADHVGSERSNVSRHLGVMVRAGVLSCRKDGLKVFYGLRTPCVAEFLSCAVRVLRQQAKENKRLLASL
jgi:DNA-binding transcriptional ArsR family regulator